MVKSGKYGVCCFFGLQFCLDTMMDWHNPNPSIVLNIFQGFSQVHVSRIQLLLLVDRLSLWTNLLICQTMFYTKTDRFSNFNCSEKYTFKPVSNFTVKNKKYSQLKKNVMFFVIIIEKYKKNR